VVINSDYFCGIWAKDADLDRFSTEQFLNKWDKPIKSEFTLINSY
jgi:hypothetical protein